LDWSYRRCLDRNRGIDHRLRGGRLRRRNDDLGCRCWFGRFRRGFGERRDDFALRGRALLLFPSKLDRSLPGAAFILRQSASGGAQCGLDRRDVGR
jgi:hypothetical protein